MNLFNKYSMHAYHGLGIAFTFEEIAWLSKRRSDLSKENVESKWVTNVTVQRIPEIQSQ